MREPRFDIVIPTLGRPSLGVLLDRLRALALGVPPLGVIVVDDRPGRPMHVGLPLGASAGRLALRIVHGGGRGPAAARNRGWRASRAPWIVFLDDDVVPEEGWLGDLCSDLRTLEPQVAGSQARIRVLRPQGRRPTDAERAVIALESAAWITADIAYRRASLEAIGGFDERFARAYREDTDLALRIQERGGRIVRGARTSLHPLRARTGRATLAEQRGNRDTVLLTALHGPRWRDRAGEPRGRLARHAAITATGALGVLAAAAGLRRTRTIATALCALGVAEFAAARIARGPLEPAELARMLWTSLAIPPLAVFHDLRGRLEVARMLRHGALAWRPPAAIALPAKLRAVLLDRDGTLIADEPGLRDPHRVSLLPSVAAALQRLRAHGVQLAVVTNQPALASGAVQAADLQAVHARLDALAGPFRGFFVCPHEPLHGCECRKPAPGLLRGAMRALGVEAGECAFIGDIGSDVEAARRVGMCCVLVPTALTRAEEIAAAPLVAADLAAAVDLLLEGAP
jgi:histidinol-phosphate phosphatase family protein